MSTAFANPSETNKSTGVATGSNGSGAGSTPRRTAVSAVINRISNPQTIDFVDVPAQEYYSTNVFTKSVMKDRLPKSVFKSLMRTIDGDRRWLDWTVRVRGLGLVLIGLS